VLRAARLMGVAGADLHLEKHLPVSSGIGGGSADAAATLRAVARLTGQPLPSPDQVLRLGADVPVCLSGRPARMSGIGETLVPLPNLPPLWVVLVNPRVPVPTPQVFAALASRDNPALPALPPNALGSALSFADWLATQTRNDLVPPALRVAPVLAKVQRAMSAIADCLLARMSGSGGTHFGLFADAASARSAAQVLSTRHPDWWVASGAVLH
jgi:4-diphosphocytidyl-2-C-methyl-D-erythritol kinase